MRDMAKESQYSNWKDFAFAQFWQEFFDLADKTKVPDDFLCDHGDVPSQKRDWSF